MTRLLAIQRGAMQRQATGQQAAQRRGTRRSRNMRLSPLLAIPAALVAIALGGCSGQATQPEPAEGRAVADKFLEQIRSNQAAQAWESTTAEFKSAEGREVFVQGLKKRPWLMKPLTFVTTETVEIGNSPRTEYIYRAANGPGGVRLLAANERGAWRIDRMKVE